MLSGRWIEVGERKGMDGEDFVHIVLSFMSDDVRWR